MQDKTGGYCPKCDTVWASPGKCRCEPDLLKALARPGDLGAEMGMPLMQKIDEGETDVFMGELATRIWNAAIEACWEAIAIRCALSQDAFEAVRKLKK